MFPLRPIPCADYCDRVGCRREPEVVLDASARLAPEFRRRRVALCLPCMAEAEAKLSARQRGERLAEAASSAALARARNPGGYA
jgi:hypothetical protein